MIRFYDVLNFLVVCRLVSAASRGRRIIEGTPLPSRTSGYSAVRYYVWISNGLECTIRPADWLSSVLRLEEDEPLDFGWLGFRCRPDSTNLQCGGSLIAPRIVQTACHCLAYFEWSSDEDKIRRAVLERQYEGNYKVYLGLNQVRRFTTGMPTSKHFVHQKCSQIPVVKGKGPVVWDYGWLFLQFSVEKWGDFPTHWIDYAPQYTRDELLNTWDHSLRTQAVCLILGFGGGKRIYPKDPFGKDDLEEEPYEEPSDFLRHGWVYTEGYAKCKNLTDWYNPEKPRVDSTYIDDATWGCGIPFTEELPTFGDGDSGGPATCNNQFVGVNSQSAYTRFERFGKNRTWISLFGGTRFVLLENALEYRAKFIKNIIHYTEFTKGGQNQPFLKFRPPSPFRQIAGGREKVATSSVRSYLSAQLDGVFRCLLVAYSSILN